jgi:hypothetical protein
MRSRYSALTKKVFKVLSKEEACIHFPEMEEDIRFTPLGHVWLMVIDERPTPLKIPPQLLGPLPKSEAEEQVKDQEDRYRSSMQSALDQINTYEKVFKFGVGEQKNNED